MIHEQASQMVIFQTLLSAGSFTEAAKRLGVSTSHVSKQLGQLEAALGVKLVQRTTRSLTLTEGGHQFAVYAKQVVDAVQGGCDKMAEQRDDVTGVIRIGLSQSFGSLHMIPAIENLRRQYPDLQVELSLFDHRADMLADRLDLWITNYEHLPEGFVAQRLADVRFVLAASPKYLVEHRAPLHPSDLQQHNCLTYRSRQRDYSEWLFTKAGESLNIKVAGNYRVDLAEAVRDAAIAGWGIAYLASYLLRDEFRDGKLIQLLPDWQPSQRMPFYAVYPSRQHLPRKISAVLNFFKTYIGDEPYWDKALRPWVQFSDE